MDKPDVDFIEGLSPGGLHRPEVDQPQPALDGRHHHRGLRLPPPALRPRGPAALPGLRRAGHPADPAADRRPAARAARGPHPLPGARPRRAGPQGRVRRPLRRAAAKGFSRARVDGEVVSLTEPPKLEKQVKHTIEVVVDRLVAKGDDTASKRRLTDSVETALGLAGGVARRRVRRPRRERPGPRAPRSPRRWPAPTTTRWPMDEIEPRSFSFNSPFGACPECTGIGTELEVDPELVVARRGARRSPRAPSRRGRRAPARPSTSSGVLAALAEDLGFSMDTPWGALPAAGPGGGAARQELQGARAGTSNRYGRERSYTHRLRGRRPVRQAPARRDRLRLEPRALRGLHARGAVPGLQGRPAQARVARRPHRRQDHRRGLRGWPSPRRAGSSTTVDFTARERQIAEQVIKEIDARLGFLLDVGLDYLIARPPGRHAVRRRGAAHPARHPDRLRPRRRALRPRRAVASACTSATTTG